MKKYIFGAVLSLGILVSPALTHAGGLTSQQIQAIVSLLQSFGADQATINNVEISLNGGTSAGGGTAAWCHTFNTDLTIGSSGDDIVALRQALGLSGITPTTSNVFDEDTAGYVVHFQAKYGIRQTGYVGPITRAKLNALYGCGVSSYHPVITVLYPTPGMTFIQGQPMTISWQSLGNPNANYILGYSASGPEGKGVIGAQSATQAHCDAADKCYISWTPTFSSPSVALSIMDSVSGLSGTWGAIAIVAPNAATPSITVLSPNGGEVWQVGSTQTIHWTMPTDQRYNTFWYLIPQGSTPQKTTGNGSFIDSRTGGYAIGGQSRVVPISSEATTVSVPSDIPAGTYKFKIYLQPYTESITFDPTRTIASDDSDASFNILAGTIASNTGLKVMLSPTSPNGTVLFAGQGIGNLADFTFSNPTASPINVTGLSFKRIGVSNDSTMTNVYLYNAGTRLTTSAGVSASAFSFSDPVALFTVPAGGSYTVSVRSDILTGTSGQQIGVQLVSVASNGMLDASVVFPINGGFQTISSANSTPLTLANITPASGPVGTSIRLDGCGSDSSSGFTLVYTGPKSGSASIPVETLGAASGCGYMTITVPSDFPAGTYSLQVENNQTGAMSTNSETFTVTSNSGAYYPATTSVSPTTFAAGASATITVANAAPNATIKVFCRDPNGAVCDDPATYTTDATGQFSHTYNTTGWTVGTYRGWVTGNTANPFWSWRSVDTGFTVTAPVVANNPVASVYPTSVAVGASFTSSVSGAAPNTQIRIFSTGPDGVTSEDTPGITDSSGKFSRTYNTNGWMGGNYRGWVTVNGVQSNVVTFNVGTGVTTTAPVASLSSSSTVQGGMFVVSVSGAPNAAVKIFCRDPNNISCDDAIPGTTDANGKFSRSYTTSGWTLGTYKGWVTVNGVQSNTVGFIITASVSLSGGTSQTASVFNAVGGSVLGNSTSQAPATTFTYVWNNNLQIGSPLTRDVKALQTALTRDGEYTGDLTGGFYSQTYAAVKAFQQKHGINTTGFVGPLTRAQLNTLFAR